MKSRFIPILALLVIGIITYPIIQNSHPSAAQEDTSTARPESERPVEEPLSPGIREDLSGNYLAGYARATQHPMQDLVLINDVLDAFDYTVKAPGALPTEGNREIVSALLGENDYRIRFLDPGFSHLNESGELVDRWRSPLFFHFEDAGNPAIRSAGPDRMLWTGDDLVWEE